MPRWRISLRTPSFIRGTERETPSTTNARYYCDELTLILSRGREIKKVCEKWYLTTDADVKVVF